MLDSSPNQPIFFSKICQDLWGGLSLAGEELTKRVFPIVERRLLDNGKMVCHRPVEKDEGQEIGFYLDRPRVRVFTFNGYSMPTLPPEPNVIKKETEQITPPTLTSEPGDNIIIPQFQPVSLKNLRRNTEQKREVCLKNLDPEIETHLAEIINLLGIKKLDRNRTFYVHTLTLTLGINPETLDRWEKDRKLIERTGVKNDGRHATFDIPEAILIGYINGHFISGGFSKNLAEDVRWYIKKCLQSLG